MQGILSLVETLLRDLRYAVRTLRRDAALTTFAILIIGVGVGASTTVFGVVNALWLRPLPFDDPGRLVWVANGPSENLSRQGGRRASIPCWLYGRNQRAVMHSRLACRFRRSRSLKRGATLTKAARSAPW